MLHILVTGGTGSLGQAVVEHLQQSEHHIRLLSRKPAPTDRSPTIEWAQGDIVTGAGLDTALANVDIVVNCTGNPQNVYETDVLGVKNLAVAAKQSHIKHFFHISIVGIEQIDLAYYQHKISAENAIVESGVPYSIQRMTQFHNLLDFVISRMRIVDGVYELPIAADALFQLIDVRDVAAYIYPLLFSEPAGRLPDIGGMEILRVDEIARIYLNTQGIADSKFVDAVKGFFPSAAVEGFRQGFNTVPNNRYGSITWADYVRAKHRATP